MEQINGLQINQKFDRLLCLPERKRQPDAQHLPEQENVDQDVFKLVVETTNYRVEIEIG